MSAHDLIQRLALADPLPPQADGAAARDATWRHILLRIDAESATRLRPNRRRLTRRLVLLTVTSTLVAGAVVAIDGLAPGGRPVGASAEATALLSRAAINATDPVVGPHQYLLVSTRGMYLGLYPLRDGRDVSARHRELREVWIPGDRSKEWVERRTSGPDTFLNPQDEQAVRADGGLTEPGVEIRRARNGEFYGPIQPSWQTPTAEFLASLPRDPDQLLARIYRDSRGQGRSKHGEALVFIADILRVGHTPADLRAALFKAATRIPGVEVTERRANLDGRTGVAVGRYESEDGTRQELIFDPDTGQVIGEREVDVERRSGVPDGILSWTSVRVRVVDTAP